MFISFSRNNFNFLYFLEWNQWKKEIFQNGMLTQILGLIITRKIPKIERFITQIDISVRNGSQSNKIVSERNLKM